MRASPSSAAASPASHAALTLQDKGVYADVYESSGRIGGRMHSDWTGVRHGLLGQRPAGGAVRRADRLGPQDDPPARAALRASPTVDLLQAQPNGTERHVLDLRRRLHVRAGEQPTSRPCTTTSRSQIQRPAIRRSYNSSTPTGQMLDQMSVHDWIAKYVPGGHSLAVRHAAERRVQRGVRRGDDRPVVAQPRLPARVPGRAGDFNDATAQSDERYHIVGGNSNLPIAIANALPSGSVHLGYRHVARSR